jgi:hypothetical protein
MRPRGPARLLVATIVLAGSGWAWPPRALEGQEDIAASCCYSIVT